MLRSGLFGLAFLCVLVTTVASAKEGKENKIFLQKENTFFDSSADDEAIEEETHATVERVIIKAYNDPRVLKVVRQAMAEKHSVSLDLTKSEDKSSAAAPTSNLEKSTAALPKQEEITHFGLLLDAGAPDGIGSSIVVRPWKWLRVHAGGTHNLVAPGIRGGVTFLPPTYFPILPTLTIEAGHSFQGDANGIVRTFSGDTTIENPSLRRVSYDYANGHLGLEFGSQNRFVFYIHGGVSYIHSNVHDFQAAVDQTGVNQNSQNLTIEVSDPTLKMLVPSGKLGFLVYFW
jgi:hypothetical protein